VIPLAHRHNDARCPNGTRLRGDCTKSWSEEGLFQAGSGGLRWTAENTDLECLQQAKAPEVRHDRQPKKVENRGDENSEAC
jgi:hypothetical protein